MKGLRQLVIVLMFGVSGTFGFAMAAQDELPVTIIDDEYAGVSMAEWDAWAAQQELSLPKAVHSSFDFSGDFCNVGQFGPVFFLPRADNLGNEPDREIPCTIPAGAAIYLSMSSRGCSTIDDPSPEYNPTEEELIACATDPDGRPKDVMISINGVPVEDPLQYHRLSPFYTFQLGPYNAYDMEPIIGVQIQDTYSFIIAPLAPGQYIIDMDKDLMWEPPIPMGHMRWIINVVEPVNVNPEATPAS